MNTRKLEKAKYDYIYGGGYKPNRYGHANYAQRIYNYIIKLDPKSVLDVGCGGGEFCKWCASKNIKSYGLDISSKPQDNRVTWLTGIAQKLPLGDNSVEFVTAFDVLEHLPPEDLHIALKEFKRVARRGIITSFHYTATTKTLNSNLHLIVQPKEWWIEQVRKYGVVMIIKRRGKDFGFIFFNDNELKR